MSDKVITGARLTRRQRLILAENRLLPDFPCNVEISRLTVDGELDHERLSNAWSAVARRYDCLRARVKADEGDFRLVFTAEEPKMSFVELSAEQLEDELRARFAQPFAIGDTMARALHARTPDGDVVVVGQSHLVTDGTTKSLIFKTLGEFYLSGRFDQQVQTRLEDFLNTTEPDDAQEIAAEEFWAEKLATPAPVLKIFGHTPRSKRGRLETSTVPIEPEIAAAIMARPDGRSPSLAMTAVLAALLHRVSGEETIALGVPFANRTKATDGIGGLFMEIVPNRIFVDSSQSLAELADIISANAKEMKPHRQHAVSGAISGHEAMLNYRPSVVEDFAGLPATQSFLTAPHILSPDTEIDQQGGVGLLFEVMRDKEGFPFEMVLHVDVARWPHSGMGARILAHFKHVLRAMAETPEIKVGAIDVVGDGADNLILGPDPDEPFPEDLPDVVKAVRRHAEASPNKVAVQFQQTSLTYSQFMEKADQITDGLIRRGVEPGDMIAVCLPRSEMLPATLLGIAGAGAAYVPLDPDHARSRLELILEDANPAIVIAAESSAKTLSETSFETVSLSELTETSAAGAAAPRPGASLDLPAYVIFTSGSTGRPKGVQVSHYNLATFLAAMVSRPGLDQTTRLLAVTTISFDISALEMFGPLIAGGTVVIAPETATRDPRALASMMNEHNVTLLQATPATWRMLVEYGWQNKNVTALTGGEALPQPLAEELVARSKLVWNMYGPTETTIWSMVCRVEAGKPVRLGTPIRGTRVSLRTNEGGLVPAGVPGEITIEGAGVADGYYGRPDLTDERFLGKAESRRYRTGDLAVLVPPLEEGGAQTLKYLGRSDHQVKIRGFRIELGEIEAQIAAVDGVSAAVVTTVAGAMGAHALAAYWSGENDEETLNAIQARIRENLPAYMYPSSLTHLDAFPQNTSGKIDRASLPAPEPDAPAMGLGEFGGASEEAQPRTEAEFELAEKIGKILGYRAIPTDVPVRDIGLDSLSFLTLSLELERSLGGSLPPQWEDMNIRELALLEPANQAFASMPVSVLVRAMLMIDIVAGHFGLFGFAGTIQGLFLVAGHSLGRFLVPACARTESARPILDLVGNIVIPTFLAVLLLQVYFGQFSPAGLLLVENYLPPDGTSSTSFWFVEVLVQCLLVLALLFSIPRYRRFTSERPLEAALATLGGFYAMNLALGQIWDTHDLLNRVPQDKLWLMALGWCVAVSRTTWQWRITTIVAIGLIGFDTLIGGHFRVQSGLALAALLLFDHVRVPQVLARFLVPISAASLFIYLSHFQIYSLVRKLPDPLNNAWIALPVALAGGVAIYFVWEHGIRTVRNLVSQRPWLSAAKA